MKYVTRPRPHLLIRRHLDHLLRRLQLLGLDADQGRALPVLQVNPGDVLVGYVVKRAGMYLRVNAATSKLRWASSQRQGQQWAPDIIGRAWATSWARRVGGKVVRIIRRAR